MTPSFSEYSRTILPQRQVNPKLNDMGEGRLKEMAKDGIDMQVVSLYQPPHIQRFETEIAKKWAKSTNDELAVACKKYPDKFVGLAAVPMQSPKDAVEELERAITKLGLKGLCLVSNAREEYFDDKKYWPVFEKTVQLDVPVYLHPTTLSSQIAKGFDAGPALNGPAMGYSTEVALHVMRLIYAGLFDKYPKLQMILGHMGEGLPYFLPRLDFLWMRSRMDRPAIKKKPSDYIKNNITACTSGMFFQPALLCTYLALGPERVAFAVDYPPEDNTLAVAFIKAAPISDEDKEKICHGNVERLFKL